MKHEGLWHALSHRNASDAVLTWRRPCHGEITPFQGFYTNLNEVTNVKRAFE